MIFSKACEYGIKAAIFIAASSADSRRVSLKSISEEIGSPEAFTAKILQMLVREKLIKSVKGIAGGFEVEEKKLHKIRLGDIVTAIDGGFDEGTCVLGLKQCSQRQPCPVHNKYKYIKRDIKALLENTTLLEMSRSLKEGHSCLNII